ncbi:MAG: hypothetical protein P8R41_11160 [Gammaproteobacteria bacterium]|nr:hypothetical protein [Gammaproteobacteria bacterium]
MNSLIERRAMMVCAEPQYRISQAKVGTICLEKVLRIVTLSIGIATL